MLCYMSSDEASELVGWIRRHGGTVHDALEVRTPGAGGDDGSSELGGDVPRHDLSSAAAASAVSARSVRQRGVFARRPIRRGETLVRLPSRLALDGRANPPSYDCPTSSSDGVDGGCSTTATTTRFASPWLRCLASLVAALADSRGGTGKEDAKGDSKEVPATGPRFDHGPYVSSLPDRYDSLLNWTTDEVGAYLRGTSLAASCAEGGDGALRERFEGTVLPYLRRANAVGMLGDSSEDVHDRDAKRRRTDDPHDSVRKSGSSEDGGSDEEKASADALFPLFREACMCISTRAFHMQSPTTSEGGADGSANADPAYDGPYLLPYVDLLNHAPDGSRSKVTTLRRDAGSGDFFMAAERDIETGEEVCHSYSSGSGGAGGGLNSAQLLRTFGFVDVASVSERLEGYHRAAGSSERRVPSDLTPAVISKVDLLAACEEVATSSYPDRVMCRMERTGMLGDGWEFWTVPYNDPDYDPDGNDEGGGSDPNWELRRRLLGGLPDDMLVTSSNQLTDEMITACAVRFLPDEALADLADDGRPLYFGRGVLSDYYLGCLVLTSVLRAVRARLASYASGLPDGTSASARSSLSGLLRGIEGRGADGAIAWGTDAADDASLLSALASRGEEGGGEVRGDDETLDRLAFGLVVSLEERTCLLGLRGVAAGMLAELDDYDNGTTAGEIDRAYYEEEY